jgi:hypothetical protein
MMELSSMRAPLMAVQKPSRAYSSSITMKSGNVHGQLRTGGTYAGAAAGEVEQPTPVVEVEQPTPVVEVNPPTDCTAEVEATVAPVVGPSPRNVRRDASQAEICAVFASARTAGQYASSSWTTHFWTART